MLAIEMDPHLERVQNVKGPVRLRNSYLTIYFIIYERIKIPNFYC